MSLYSREPCSASRNNESKPISAKISAVAAVGRVTMVPSSVSPLFNRCRKFLLMTGCVRLAKRLVVYAFCSLGLPDSITMEVRLVTLPPGLVTLSTTIKSLVQVSGVSVQRT